ncbi:glutamate-5-semialdehyde dehydrogenase [Actinotignum urinale]|uniref:Gamma-glutamyl phosphate reductase n=1 Tax=Actinotignum urinale TaxID=190146 RepID=A0ABU5G8H8_9ACTO|nr:glutamate-5-semialdehyde dehydrogenase [Actinotignum urinale]MDY5133487.1 glutamate-5-semialdehyde dehydrogenase [Actinotignum urinale]MDY5151836.1 glutamate-5-semialdehyde dehydrogenase [Actinotignum urinale]MDY5160031.1 glutamate-5-semialdehyde dehydrogenase [Actinotignum urinale]WIK58830.1 glutamate-5-semialdehyde dehydrogenase [Actinotignum urinale]
MTQQDIRSQVTDIARAARAASSSLRTASTAQKNALLQEISSQLRASVADIVAANAKDVARGRNNGMNEGLIDRLVLDEARICGIADAVDKVVFLPDPVGEVVRGNNLANGMRLRQVRVPMGVIGMIYEARPNVTVDAATLAVKAGSAVILRGGSAALESNEVLVDIMRRAAKATGFPENIIQSIDFCGREGAVELMKLRGLIDVVIPRGGAGLIQTVVRESLVPVIETGVGNCHVYIDKENNPQQALDIVVNSKTHRCSVCNAAESLLVHRDIASSQLPGILHALSDAGVTLHVDEETAGLVPELDTVPATQKDWEREYLSMDMAVKIVGSLDEAIEHISRYSTGHTESICSTNVATINEFTARVDSAVVMVNASTRFTDGGEFGLGAEIGISTQKLHARGPMALEEMTTTMWIAEGNGHVR